MDSSLYCPLTKLASYSSLIPLYKPTDMQILRWLFKSQQEEQGRETDNIDINSALAEAKSKKSIPSKKRGGYRKPKRSEEVDTTCKNSTSFKVLLGRGNAKAYFSRSLNLKRLGSFVKRQHWSAMGHKADSTAHVGNKVLPICDATASTSTTVSDNQCGSSEKKDKPKGDRTKTLSRMKELLRWAAAAKTEKGGKYISRKVMQFRNRGNLKTALQDDNFSSSSPKISFRWDSDTCSTTSTVYTSLSLPCRINDPKCTKPSLNSTSDDALATNGNGCTTRRGNWITTDDEFVVLEL